MESEKSSLFTKIHKVAACRLQEVSMCRTCRLSRTTLCKCRFIICINVQSAEREHKVKLHCLQQNHQCQWAAVINTFSEYLINIGTNSSISRCRGTSAHYNTIQLEEELLQAHWEGSCFRRPAIGWFSNARRWFAAAKKLSIVKVRWQTLIWFRGGNKARHQHRLTSCVQWKVCAWIIFYNQIRRWVFFFTRNLNLS